MVFTEVSALKFSEPRFAGLTGASRENGEDAGGVKEQGAVPFWNESVPFRSTVAELDVSERGKSVRFCPVFPSFLFGWLIRRVDVSPKITQAHQISLKITKHHRFLVFHFGDVW